MAQTLCRSGDVYYTAGLAARSARSGRREDDQWVSSAGQPPAGAERVDFGDLPAELREEILAVAARADVMRQQSWN